MTSPILRRLAGASTLALLAAGLVAAPASASGGSVGRGPDLLDPVTTGVVPVTITGDGFGHGKGMSQYGALGAAQEGLRYKQILAFYYPGTAWGRSGGSVRVLITGDTSRDVVVVDRSRLRVTALGSGRSWTPGQDASRWRIQPTADGLSVISYRTGRWHEWRTVSGDAQFSAGGRPITLVTPGGRVAYRGILRSATPSDLEPGAVDRDTVNVVPLDDYVRGVVPQEVPAQWPTQTVRSQAVAARTYAAHERAAAPADRHYQLCDTAHCQVYGGFSAEQPESNEAVADTAGKVLTYGGEPAFTQFSASNGGWSTAGNFTYLPAQKDPYDHAYRNWSATFEGADVTRHWTGLGDLVDVEVTKRDANGKWVLEVEVTGTEGSVVVSGEDFASYLGLKSYFFDDPVLG